MMWAPINDVAQATAYAITVRADASGWSWSLIDPAGRVATTGRSADQDAAMRSAWEAARDRGRDSLEFDYPDILLGDR